MNIVMSNGTVIYPSFDSVVSNTGTPVCQNETVTFTIDWNANDEAKFRVNCYPWYFWVSWSDWTSYYDSDTDVQITCDYDYISTDTNTRVQLQTTRGLIEDYYISMEVSSDSAICHNTGEGAFDYTEQINETAVGFTDLSTVIPDVLNSLGFGSASSLMIFGVMVLAIFVGYLTAVMKLHFIPVSIMTVILVIALALAGIFPTWIIVLIIIIAGALLSIGISKGLSGSGSSE